MGLANMDFFVRELRNITDGPMLLIRFGTCGGLSPEVKAGSIAVATEGAVLVTRDPDSLLDSESDSDQPALSSSSSSKVSSIGPAKREQRPLPYRLSRIVRPDSMLSAQLEKELSNCLQPSVAIVSGLNATADGFYASRKCYCARSCDILSIYSLTLTFFEIEGRADPHFEDGLFRRPCLGLPIDASQKHMESSAKRQKFENEGEESSAEPINAEHDYDEEQLLPHLMNFHPTLKSMEMESFQLLALARSAKPKGSVRAAAAAIIVANRPTGDVVDADTFRHVENMGGRAVMSALAAVSLEEERI